MISNRYYYNPNSSMCFKFDQSDINGLYTKINQDKSMYSDKRILNHINFSNIVVILSLFMLPLLTALFGNMFILLIEVQLLTAYKELLSFISVIVLINIFGLIMFISYTITIHLLKLCILNMIISKVITWELSKDELINHIEKYWNVHD